MEARVRGWLGNRVEETVAVLGGSSGLTEESVGWVSAQRVWADVPEGLHCCLQTVGASEEAEIIVFTRGGDGIGPAPHGEQPHSGVSSRRPREAKARE